MSSIIKKLSQTLAILTVAASLLAPAARADQVQAMRTALQLTAGGDWAGAAAVAPSGVGRDVVEWQRLRAGEGQLGEYEDFLNRRPDWPGLSLLREKGETAVARSTSPDRVIAWFGNRAPQTGTGAVALVRALKSTGQDDVAADVAMRAWSAVAFSAEDAQAMLALVPKPIALVHEVRMDHLLWQGRQAEAARQMPLMPPDWQALAQARLGLRADVAGVNGLIAAVPKALQSDAGLAYERFIWRMKRDLYDDALPLILERSDSAARLGDPEEWAPRRAILTRWLMRKNRPTEAYRVASRHHLASGGSGYADLEFLAGFIALRRLNDPQTALKHFNHLEAGVATPISIARAQYWKARAHEAMGAKPEALAEYKRAAQHQTAYYGLLAAEKLGASLDPALISDKRPPDWRQAAWAKSSVHQAAQLLLAAGDLGQAKRFWLHLAEGLDATGLDQMGDMALALGQPHIAVLVGKQAAERGIILTRSYYPVADLVPDGLAVSRAFAMAIARRESEFDPAARSHADARGLMQLLPGTAKQMATELGLPFEAAKLFTDPGYNAKLGSAYLAHLIEQFGPSIALVASGYNAGPSRPKQWIEDYGDPRLPSVDVVDWVESIPFSETRTYVMRVVEGVVIYRAKLRGSVGPVNVTAELKG